MLFAGLIFLLLYKGKKILSQIPYEEIIFQITKTEHPEEQVKSPQITLSK